jgi:hypothetical protein
MPLEGNALHPTIRQILGKFSRAKLGSLEAQLRPVEHLDKEVEIGCRDWVSIIMEV